MYFNAVVTESWTMVDRWWTAEPERIEYCVVELWGRFYFFKKTSWDPVWRCRPAI